MNRPLLHVFRNTPFGRETLLQSAYTCRRMQRPLDIYLPKDKKFLFYFDNEVVQVDLDRSYLHQPETAQENAEAMLQLGPTLTTRFFQAEKYTATGLPDLSPGYGMMTCPRSMSDQTSRIGLGFIGSKVRRILQTAPFPILIPSPVYKPWTRLAVLYGGSDAAAGALRLALKIQQRCNVELRIFSLGDRKELSAHLEQQGLADKIQRENWHVFSSGRIGDHLNQVPHDALVVLGAYGHGPIKALFGSTMETIQAGLPNNLLVTGPKFNALTTQDAAD
ncbi:hypothetical protein [Geothermobacter hydrogeniphilus]|uniref:Universal stress protein family protein n=1 Tax=Geothermobacter hydrogeniphilus TaxID=1969733 RepID=A0A1X0YCL7_9BACT|nr:hypothetical protein [Geothermobacter hydrogeniphilus]ORJ62961.1 hypothetical protein B5V00_02610 [Geothermobacter hydrogeniphilus]